MEEKKRKTRSAVAMLPSLREVAVLFAFSALPSLAVHAQMGLNPQAIPDSRPSLSPGRPDEDPLRDHPELRERMERGRAAERQRRIVDDANRLVALTAQYRKALEAHGTPTGEDGKLLLQIEKLARDVKDRMRGM